MDNDVEVYNINEGETRTWSAIMRDAAGAPLPGSALSTLVLTIREEYAREIIHARDRQNVLNTNGVTVGSGGELVWTVDPLDVTLLSRAAPTMLYRILFEWSYVSGPVVREGGFEFLFAVHRYGARA